MPVYPLTRADVSTPKVSPSITKPRNLDALQVIVKVAEQCNLACTYCYYYFMGDDSFKGRDPVMKVGLFDLLVEYLEAGVKDLGLKKLSITFHGGEPLLMKLQNFEQLCEKLRQRLSPIVSLSLSIQTNGVLLSEAWVILLKRHRVTIGVSIDGPKQYHDHYRVDKKSRGSYDAIASNLTGLITTRNDSRINDAGTLSVMNRRFDPAVVFEHLVDVFAVKHLGFLLPDVSWDTGFSEGECAEIYGQQLAKLFDVWLDRDDVYVREMNRAVEFFQVFKAPITQSQENYENVNPEVTSMTDIIIVQSTGHVAVDDSLVPALNWRKNILSPHLTDMSLRDFVYSQPFHDLQRARETIPDGCQKCEWKNLCRGGALENRFSRENGFNNPSIYCEGLKLFYDHVRTRLVEAGYPATLFAQKLLDAAPNGRAVTESEIEDALV